MEVQGIVEMEDDHETGIQGEHQSPQDAQGKEKVQDGTQAAEGEGNDIKEYEKMMQVYRGWMDNSDYKNKKQKIHNEVARMFFKRLKKNKIEFHTTKEIVKENYVECEAELLKQLKQIEDFKHEENRQAHNLKLQEMAEKDAHKLGKEDEEVKDITVEKEDDRTKIVQGAEEDEDDRTKAVQDEDVDMQDMQEMQEDEDEAMDAQSTDNEGDEQENPHYDMEGSGGDNIEVSPDDASENGNTTEMESGDKDMSTEQDYEIGPDTEIQDEYEGITYSDQEEEEREDQDQEQEKSGDDMPRKTGQDEGQEEVQKSKEDEEIGRAHV